MGPLGSSGAGASSFFLWKRLMALIMIKITSATRMKSMMVVRKVPMPSVTASVPFIAVHNGGLQYDIQLAQIDAADEHPHQRHDDVV
mgnify:CR=1 FL=1